MKTKKNHIDMVDINNEYLNNEYRTNKIVAMFLSSFLTLAAVNTLVLYLQSDMTTFGIFTSIFTPVNTVLATVIIIAAVYRFRKPWIKYMFLVTVTLASEITFFFLTTYALYMVLVPIFIATRYFDKKSTIVVSVSTALLFAIACVMNVYLDPISDFMAKLHLNATYYLWNNMVDTMSYYCIPCLFTMFYMLLFGVNITLSGDRLIASKVEKTQIIAEVDAEINMAAKIQKSVLPASRFTSPDGNFETFAYEVPAKEVCGDFYDYFMLNNDVLAVIVADVSDKGMPAAMFMMSAKKVLQAALLSNSSLEGAIKLANRLICNDNQSDMFLTLWMGLIDTKSGVGKYVNAGHPYPIIRHKDGEIEFIENEPDLFIGNFPECTPKVHTFRMRQGDTVVIYTDGLTDATDKNGNGFNIGRVSEALKSDGNRAEDIVSGVIGDLEKFSKGSIPFDDITVFALKCNNLCPPEKLHLKEPIGIQGTAKINDTVMETLKKAKCPDEKRRNIGVVVDEICDNIFQYAYPDGEGTIDFHASVYNNCLEMTFADSGTPFNPLLQYNRVPDTLQIGGYGIYFVKQLTDCVTYEYRDSQNQLTLLVIWDI